MRAEDRMLRMRSEGENTTAALIVSTATNAASIDRGGLHSILASAATLTGWSLLKVGQATRLGASLETFQSTKAIA